MTPTMRNARSRKKSAEKKGYLSPSVRLIMTWIPICIMTKRATSLNMGRYSGPSFDEMSIWNIDIVILITMLNEKKRRATLTRQAKAKAQVAKMDIKIHRVIHIVQVSKSKMECNGRIVLPPANANANSYTVSELWFIHRNLPDSLDTKMTTDFKTLAGYAKVHEQCRSRKCSYKQIDNDLLNKMNQAQYPSLQ